MTKRRMQKLVETGSSYKAKIPDFPMIFSVFNGKDARSRGVPFASFSKNYRGGIRVKTFCLSTPPFLPIVRLNVGQPQTKRTSVYLSVFVFRYLTTGI